MRDESGRLLFVPCSPCNGPTPKVAAAPPEPPAAVPSVLAQNGDPGRIALRLPVSAEPAAPPVTPASPVSALVAAADMSAADLGEILALRSPIQPAPPVSTTPVRTAAPASAGAPPALPQATRLVEASRQFVVSPPAQSSNQVFPAAASAVGATAVVFFEHAQSRLTEQGRAAITALARSVPKGAIVYVRGSTDATGDPVKNAILARNRAAVVRALLMATGVARANIRTDFCTTCFLGSNDTEEGRRANRRVDISVGQPPGQIAPGQSTPAGVNA